MCLVFENVVIYIARLLFDLRLFVIRWKKSTKLSNNNIIRNNYIRVTFDLRHNQMKTKCTSIVVLYCILVFYCLQYWCNVSDEAKEFVAILLTVDPNQRPSAELALLHPWISAALYCHEKPPRPLQKSRSLDPSKHRVRKINRQQQTNIADKKVMLHHVYEWLVSNVSLMHKSRKQIFFIVFCF